MTGYAHYPISGRGEVPNAEAADAKTDQRTVREGVGDEASLPPVLDLPQAAAMLGLGRTTAYRLVAEQQWPTPVLRLGRLIKIPTQPLLELLRGAWPPVAIGIEQSTSAVARTPVASVVRRG
jgi:predicted DNA-binding transcriptional regulator AlpA